jgi:hypothetical protein
MSSKECDEIKGVGFWNAEESMDWVKNLLIQKKIQKNGGKKFGKIQFQMVMNLKNVLVEQIMNVKILQII